VVTVLLCGCKDREPLAKSDPPKEVAAPSASATSKVTPKSDPNPTGTVVYGEHTSLQGVLRTKKIEGGPAAGELVLVLRPSAPVTVTYGATTPPGGKLDGKDARFEEVELALVDAKLQDACLRKTAVCAAWQGKAVTVEGRVEHDDADGKWAVALHLKDAVLMADD
jgi:hypothetical protein